MHVNLRYQYDCYAFSLFFFWGVLNYICFLLTQYKRERIMQTWFFDCIIGWGCIILLYIEDSCRMKLLFGIVMLTTAMDECWNLHHINQDINHKMLHELLFLWNMNCYFVDHYGTWLLPIIILVLFTVGIATCWWFVFTGICIGCRKMINNTEEGSLNMSINTEIW